MTNVDNDLPLDIFIARKLNLKPKTEQFIKAYAATVKYLASGYKSFPKYHTDLQSCVDFSQLEFSAADFRLQLGSICRYTLKMRFYALAVSMHKDTNSIVGKYAAYGLSKQEAVLAWNHLLKIEANRKTIRNSAKIKHKSLKLSMVSPKEMHLRLEQTNVLFAELYNNARRRVRKLMRWVCTAHNTTIEDLTCDLMCKVLQSYYQSLPNLFSLEHQLNYLRATVENRIRNMNNYYAAGKRRRMEKVGEDRYEIIVMSDNQLQKAFGTDDNEVNYESMLGEDARVHTEQMENNLTISKLLEETAGSKRYKLYATVLGRDCADFTEWLRSNDMMKDTMTCGTEWLMAKSPSHIRRALAKWLNVSVSSVNSGLDSLQSALQTA